MNNYNSKDQLSNSIPLFDSKIDDLLLNYLLQKYDQNIKYIFVVLLSWLINI